MKLTEKQLDRFWSSVNKDGRDNSKLELYKHLDNCWEWTARLICSGYGRIFLNGKYFQSHRISAEIYNGKIPKGMLILHECDNRKCVNPDHLYAGTYADNIKDRDTRGRGACGEENGNSKLTKEIVNDIREKYSTGKYTYKKLADEYNVNISLISLIVRNKIWKDKNYLLDKSIDKKIKRLHNYKKLDDIKVKEIREKYATGKYTYKKLADEYDVTISLISYIINRKIWKHV